MKKTKQLMQIDEQMNWIDAQLFKLLILNIYFGTKSFSL